VKRLSNHIDRSNSRCLQGNEEVTHTAVLLRRVGEVEVLREYEEGPKKELAPVEEQILELKR